MLSVKIDTVCLTALFTIGFVSQEAYPVKLKEVHVINGSSVVETIINFVKPFLKEKIRDRVRTFLYTSFTHFLFINSVSIFISQMEIGSLRRGFKILYFTYSIDEQCDSPFNALLA